MKYQRINYQQKLSFCLALLVYICSGIYAQSDKISQAGIELDSLKRMSLLELLNVKVVVPAAMTRLTKSEIPASVTVISSEDIKYTPARNIYDLLEVYVPGAIWMNYEDGPQLGVRGNIANRNYKYLLRVDGRVMNNKGHYGAKSELEQWDMSDIQQIEIVRGPGSVIYGAGAVAGVINIITHDADSAQGFKADVRYVNKYKSGGLAMSHGISRKNIKIFSHASVTRTKGFEARNFIGTNNQTAGYISEDILPDSRPLDYFADYQDIPQVKLHLDIDLFDHWRFWSRYSQQGSTWRGNEVKSLYDNKLINQQGVRDRQWTNTFQYDKDLNEKLLVSSMISFDFADVERRRDGEYHIDPDHVLNKEINFSETEYLFRTIFNWQAFEQLEIALGTEYSWDLYGPGWGDIKEDMVLGEDGIIICGLNSNYLERANRNESVIFTDEGWSTNTYSLFTEINFTLSSWSKLLFSARSDKNTYSDWLFSPRIALIFDISDGHNMKLIAQQAQRMSTAGQLFALDWNGNSPENETLNGIEFIYSSNSNKPLSFVIATFLNSAEVIAWDNGKHTSSPVGDLKVYGIEPELSYKWDNGRVGLNYSFVKQIDWKLAEGVNASGISYSDYNQQLKAYTAVQLGVGNDLNNWFTHALKFYSQVSLNKKLMIHINTSFFRNMQGAKDGLTGLTEAVEDSPEEAVIISAVDRVYEVGAYNSDFRLNATLNYSLTKNLSIHVFAQNLLGKDGNKRYSYDYSGNNRTSPHRVRFIEEPRVLGMSLTLKI